MWIWIIIAAVVIGGIIGLANDDSGEGCLGGALTGGCMASSCLWQILITGISILIVIWLFNAIFG